MESYTTAVLLGCFNNASLLKKVVRSFMRFMKGIVVIMPVQSPWWPKLFVMDFIS